MSNIRNTSSLSKHLSLKILPRFFSTICLLGIIFSFGGLFVSCEKNQQQTKQVFRANFSYEPTTLDPRKGCDAITSLVHFMLYEGLTKITPKSTHELGLANKIDLSENKLIYTFHLKDTYWSNGDLVTAYDFQYAWSSMLDPKFPCPNAHLLYPIKNAESVKKGILPTEALGIAALDSHTFQVTLETPTPYFLDLTSFCVFFPVPKKIAEKDPKWADSLNPNLITNGPFSLISWRKCNEMIYVKNPNFWKKGYPKLDRVELSIINNEITALGMYQSNELDFLGCTLTSIPPDWIGKFASQGILQSKPLGATTFSTFNLNTFPFNNKNIRKAFAYAINRKDIIDNITQFDEIVATGCIPPVLKNQIDKSFYQDGNKELARKYLTLGLKELGVKKEDLNGLVLSYFSADTYKRIAQTLQEQWRSAFEIDIKLDENDFKVTMDKFNRKDYQIGLMMWMIQYNDQMGILDRFKLKKNPKNYPGWENPEYIKLLDQSAQSKNEKERVSILSKAEELITDEMPFSCIFHWNSIFLKKDTVKDIHISPIGSIHLDETYIES